MSAIKEQQNKRLNLIITIISIALPLIVAILFGIRLDIELPFNVYILPAINAVLNGASALLLIGALVAVKRGNIKLHSSFIYTAMGFSLAFLLIYVFYHISTTHTAYCGVGGIRYLYFTLLITHILLAIIQAPLVLFAFLYGYTGQIDRHKKLVKFSYPVWLYVSVTGVICYLMISPCYGA
jgi:putative membrane protein